MIKRKVLIVGGGSSGWMAAAYLQKALNVSGIPNQVEITLVESPDIPTISVGEATIPSIRHLLSVIEVDELDFMRATDATFKQSIKYVNWEKNDNSFYHHPFSRIRKQPLDNSAQLWLDSNQEIPFMETCSEQPIICEMGLAPVMMNRWDFGQPLTYAYQMNAKKFADYLRSISIPRGVKHIMANVTEVKLKENGHISSVATDREHKLEADLFIDCTGFRAKLIEETLGVGFQDCSQWLLCDTATTMHVPYDSHYPGLVRPYTTATALTNGWVWDIPLQTKRSIGYVHSSKFINTQEADKELRNYQGGNTDNLESRTIHFKVGHRQKHWHGNCIALGLSGGFIEPLESTGLYLSDLGSVMLAEHFPFKDEHMNAMAYRYNRIMSNRFYEVLDFINLHYCTTKRTDTKFWQEVQKPERITDRLKAKLVYWQNKSPSMSDFDDQSFLNYNPKVSSLDKYTDNRPNIDTASLWNHESYECIMYGMHFNDNSFENHMKPKLQIHPYIINRLQTAQHKLPKHDVWLKQYAGMKDYPYSVKPNGWR
jgi:tryptophan halogenase